MNREAGYDASTAKLINVTRRHVKRSLNRYNSGLSLTVVSSCSCLLPERIRLTEGNTLLAEIGSLPGPGAIAGLDELVGHEDAPCPRQNERGAQTMASVECTSMDNPDETRAPPTNLTVSVARLGAATAKRLTAEPGFRWSECIQPMVGGDSCESAHLGYVISGTLHIASDDGVTADLGPGDAYSIDPGHDAWVLGDEPFVAIEFETNVKS